MSKQLISLFELSSTWQLSLMATSAYFAMAIVGVIVGLLSWHALKDRVYLLFSIYLASLVAIILFAKFPFLITEIASEDLYKLRYTIVLGSLANLAHIFFTRELIQPHKNMPKLYKIWLIVIGLLFLSDAIAVIITNMSTWNYRNTFMMLFTLSNLILMVKASVRMPYVRWYIAGIVVFVLGSSPLIMYNAGLLKNLNVYTASAPFVAAFAETLFFIIGIVGRMRAEHLRNLQEHRIKMLGTLATEVFHEVAAPLTVIYGYSKIIDKECDEITDTGVSEKIKANIQKIITSTQRINANIERFKLLADTGYSVSHKENISLKLIIDEAIELSLPRLEKRNIKFDCNSVEIENLNVIANRFELEQVISNLLNNAADAAAETSEKWVKLVAFIEGKHILIKITDSGKGIPQTIQEKIFLPFFTTKKNSEGTGVGLSVSMRFVKDHKGNLSIDEKSENTCFIIKLPLFN